MVNLYLVRHAHSAWEGVYTDDITRGLSPKGNRDAQKVGAILQSYPIQAIYCSPFRRAIETIQPLAIKLALPIITNIRLAERKVSSHAVDDFQKAITFLWQHPTNSLQGGESNLQAQKRGVSLIQDLLHNENHNHIVFSTHGNLLTLILQYFYPEVGYYFWTQLTFPDVYYFRVLHKSQNIAGDKYELTWQFPKRIWDLPA